MRSERHHLFTGIDSAGASVVVVATDERQAGLRQYLAQRFGHVSN